MNGPNQKNIKHAVKWVSDHRRFLHVITDSNADGHISCLYSKSDKLSNEDYEGMVELLNEHKERKSVTKSNKVIKYIGTECAK